MTKQNRDFVASTRPTFVFDEPSFDEQPGTVGAPMILRPGTQMRNMPKPLPKISNRKAIAAHVSSLAWQIEMALLPVAKLHRDLKDTLQWVIYWDTVPDENFEKKAARAEKERESFENRFREATGRFMKLPADWLPLPGQLAQFQAKLQQLMAQRSAIESSAAAKATSLAKQLATYMSVHGASIAAAQSLVTQTVNAVEQFDKQFDVPCPASYVRDLSKWHLYPTAYSVPCIFNTSGQVALEQAILRARDLQQMASQQFGAPAPGIAQNTALAELAGVEPATISCPPGQALYMGRCVPRVRVPGGTLGAPAGRPAMYVVAPGDTTSGIAEKLGVSVPALLAANASRPRMQLRSGHWVFKNLTEREKLNVPRHRTIGLAGAPGALSAGPGEACGYTDWCDSGYHCENGVCVPDFVPAQAGLSNTGAYCDAGGGPQSGYIGEGGACIPLGGNTQGAGSNTLIGNVVCPGPNMHPDWDNISAWQCVCDDGFTDDPNGPGCVPVGTPGTYTVGSQQFYEECVAAGGEIDPATGQCRAKGGVSGQGTQFGGKSTSGGAAGGGKAGATTGGKAGPVEPVDGKSSLIGSLSSTAKTVIMIGGGVLAVAAVGGGAYAIAKHRKDAKMKAKGGKDEKKPSPKALPPKKK